MRNRRALPVALVLLLVAAGCGPGQTKTLPPLKIQAGCNPLAADWDCMLPYPSDVFRVKDASLPSGYRVKLSRNATLHTDKGEAVDFTVTHPADGFSILPQILVLFPKGVDDSNLPFLADAAGLKNRPGIATSTTAASPTALIDAKTGTRILHLAELNPRTTDPSRQGLSIRPLVRLEHSTRYIVAIHGLKDKNGNLLAPPEGFRRIRDQQTAGDPVLGPLADHYEKDIFPALKKAGIDRSTLQLAWDFTTESEKNVTADMFAMRDELVASLKQTPPTVAITKVNDSVGDGHTFRRIDGTLTVPLFMDSAQAGAAIHRDSTGKVAENGTVKVPFLMLIPNSVAADIAAGKPADRIFQFGHGFFGSREEIASHYVYKFADREHMVVFGVDWWGMSTADAIIAAGDLLSDMSNGFRFADRTLQGMANFIALTYAAPQMTQDAFKVPDDGGTLKPAFDPGTIYYYGISQGGILGGTYVALAPKIQKATLSVSGAGFPFMMFRATPFSHFLDVINENVSDPLDQRKFVTLTSTVFDRFDPIEYAPWDLHGRTADDPAERQILMQTGIGDTEVPNPADHLQARAIGVTHMIPAPRDIVDLPSAQGPLKSALVEWDFGIPKPLPGTYAKLAAADNQVHEGVRIQTTAEDMIDQFFQPGGMIHDTCNGPCVAQ